MSRRFEPVFLPPERALNGRVSQTTLRHFSACPRSGYLAALYKGGVSTGEMVRGTAVHLVHERAVRLMLENGEVTIPEEVVKDIADGVLAELPVPFTEHDSVREMAWRMAQEIEVDPETVVSAETLFVVDVPVPCPHCHGSGRAGGADTSFACMECDGDGTMTFEVRCRIDFAELRDEGARVHVEDLKSSKAAVTQDEIARKRPDGSLSAKAFQLVLYAIVLAYGVPVREEACAACRDQWTASLKPGGPDVPMVREDCADCRGKGRVEVREPFPVASRAQIFDLEYVYPAIPGSDDKMLRRTVTLTRGELEQYRVSLAGLVARLARAEVTGDWPAVVSDAACGECPASGECPVKKELKDHRGTVNTADEAAEAFEVLAREKKEQAARTKELTAFVKAQGPVRFGGEMVAEIVATSSTEIKDKDGFMAAVEMTAQYGTPLDRGLWVKEKQGKRLVLRALTADELVELASEEGSNG